MCLRIVELVSGARAREGHAGQTVCIQVLVLAAEYALADVIYWVVVGVGRAGHASERGRVVDRPIWWTDRDEVIGLAGVGFRIQSVPVLADVAGLRVGVIDRFISWAFRMGSDRRSVYLDAYFLGRVVDCAIGTRNALLGDLVEEGVCWTTLAYVLSRNEVSSIRAGLAFSARCIIVSPTRAVYTGLAP